MKRTLVAVALFAPATYLLAQKAPAASPPVVHAKVTVLGELRDTTLDGSQTPQESALSPSGTLIAYNTDKDLRLWSSTTRSSSVLLTGWSESIVWSPAGDAIAFAHEGDQGGQESIWTIRLDRTTGRMLGSPQRVSISPSTANAPQFSPDGKLIAFPRADGGGRRTSLVVVAPTGGAERAVASGFGIRRLRWSPDASSINYVAYSDSTRKNATMYRVALNGAAPRIIHEVGDVPALPGFSGDARFIEFPQPTTLEVNSFVLADFNAKPVATAAYPWDVWFGDWSGATRAGGVRYARPRGLRLVNVADGKSRDLYDTKSEVASAAWFADGRRIAVIVLRNGVFALEVKNIDGTGTRRFPLTSLPQWTADPEPHGASLRVSPDGRYATFLGKDRATLELMDLSSGQQRTLVRTRMVLTPFWRRDSKSIRYIRLDGMPITDENRGVHEVSITGDDKLVRGLPRSQYPNIVWSIDDNTIAAFGAGTHTTILLDGRPDQVTSRVPAQGGGQISPDGRTMALRLGKVNSEKPAGKITLVSLNDLSQRSLDLSFSDAGGMAFAPDGRSVFIRGRDGSDARVTIYSVPLDGKPPRAIAQVESRENHGLFSLSPDGGSILQSVSDGRRATFVAMDFSELNARVTQAGKAP